MTRPKIGVIIHTKLRDRILSKEDAGRLEELGDVTWTDSPDPVSVEEAIGILEDCEIAIGSWGTPKPDAEIVPACPRLRLWVHAAGSVSHFFGPHLEGRDLTIASCKHAIGDNVAEMALAEVLLGVRRAFENAAANRLGRAPKLADFKVLSRATVGIVGASAVGRKMIELLRPFGPEVLLYDPYVSEGEAKEMGVELVGDLVEVCRRSDAVSLHTPALPSTEKMIGRRELAAMKDDCVFVNTSRGMCVDEEALIGELERGRLFAILDVTRPEPPADDSPLRTLPNVVLTSHIAGGPADNIGRQAVDDVQAFIEGREPKCIVTADQLDHIA